MNLVMSLENILIMSHFPPNDKKLLTPFSLIHELNCYKHYGLLWHLRKSHISLNLSSVLRILFFCYCVTVMTLCGAIQDNQVTFSSFFKIPWLGAG